MTTIHHSPPPGATPFAIYEDPEDQMPPSPSEVYEGDVSFNSGVSLPGADEALPSIENEHENEREPTDGEQLYKGSYTSRSSILSSSRRASGVTTTSFISSLPSEISIASKPAPPANGAESRYSPRKERPPFRNPSSVRAMQMASPPPLPHLEASKERLKGNYKLATPSRSSRSESVSTTSTRRSRHRDSVHREIQAQPSPQPTPTPQQHFPLVLLHVTILPLQLPYAHDFMLKHMPDWMIENYRLLTDKLQDIVLMRRGLLIQHPRDEYDVLEERILESLELKTPRLLKCGHFLGSDAEVDESKEDEDDKESVTDDGMGRRSRMSGGTITNEEEAEWKYPTPDVDEDSVCTDCHRQVKRPGKGVGTGTKRWDIKIFAANGLMRAGAWSAAWSEMERCDVEISPWIPEGLRKSLEKMAEDEQEAAKRKQLYADELKRQMEEEATRQRRLEEEAEVKKRAEEAKLQQRIEAEAAALQRKLEDEALEKKRLEETLNEKIEKAKEAIRLEFEAQALAEANAVAERLRYMEEALKREQEKTAPQAPPVLEVPPVQHYAHSRSRGRARSSSRRPQMDEIPMGTLLRNYILLLLRDSRNFFILLLGALVVFLAMHTDTSGGLHHQSLDLAGELPMEYVNDAVAPVVITSTATMTATSISTMTVTEVQALESPYESLPLSAKVAPSPLDEAISSASSQKVANPTDASILSQTSLEDPISSTVSSEIDEVSSPATSETTSTSYDEEPFPSGSSSPSAASIHESASLPSASEHKSASPDATSSSAEPADASSTHEPSSEEPKQTIDNALDELEKDEL